MKDKSLQQQHSTGTSPRAAQPQNPVARSYSQASSLGVLAADEHESEVRLTRFSPLPQESVHAKAIVNDQQLIAQNFDNARVTDDIITHINLNNNNNNNNRENVGPTLTAAKLNGKRPARSSNNKVPEQTTVYNVTGGVEFCRDDLAETKSSLIDELAARELELQMALFKQRQLAQGAQEFQVVWRSLSFEVETSTYDRLMNVAFDGLNSMLKFGCLSGKSKSSSAGGGAGAGAGMSSTSELATNQQVSASDESLPKQKRPAGSRRTVFKHLNGYIKSGEISAILGPSGAGKTSLLTALCGGKMDNYRGSIQLLGGGDRRDRMHLSIIPQKDYLVENLTVRENLVYSSQLLNSDRNFNHDANIMRVIKMLNLNNCLDSPASNISGGEYKRVSIAQELLRQPDILILDEPTSGLDSLNCKKLIQSLKQLIEASKYGALKPIAVVMTIHQPDIDIFNMFDHVYCMARGGKVVFDGHPSQAMSALKSHSGFVAGSSNCPPELSNHEHVNPANLLIEIASGELYGSEPIEKLARYQRKQFEQLFGSHSSDTERLASNSAAQQPIHHHQDAWNMTKLDVGQLQANLFSGQHQHTAAAAALGGPKGQMFSPLANQFQRNFKATQPPSSSPSTSSSSSSSSESASLSSSNGPPSPASTLSSRAIVMTPPENYAPAHQPGDSNLPGSKALKRDKRLRAKHDHRGKFWYHTGLLARRAFVSTLRDPLMTMVVMLFHLFLPFVMWMVYPNNVGRINACPVIQRDLDIVSMASNRTLDKMRDMQSDMMATVECSTMLFITTYALSMCSLTVAALAFPLNMHILLKEVRNGWYDLKTFVLAKQIACFPFEVVFPCVTMALIYLMLDMPSSEYEWRLWSIALVMATIAMISNSHGLIIGTLCMDSVQTSVFLSISSTLPQVLLSGFTSRLKWLPAGFRALSWLSQYRYGNELINMIRFGFDICPCDDETDEYLRSKKPSFNDIPENIKPMFLYYLSAGSSSSSQNDQLAQAANNLTNTIGQNVTNSMSDLMNSSATMLMNGNGTTTTTTLAGSDQFKPYEIAGISRDLVLNSTERNTLLAKFESNELDIFEQMAEVMTRSLSFGREINSCKSVKSQLLNLTEGETEDMFFPMLGYMLAVLMFFKVLLFFVVRYKVGSRI